MAAATKKNSDIVTEVPHAEKETGVQRIPIKLPKREDDDNPGVKVDKYEHVTIANERGEDITWIKRGEWVDVTYRVFEQLIKRYPDMQVGECYTS